MKESTLTRMAAYPRMSFCSGVNYPPLLVSNNALLPITLHVHCDRRARQCITHIADVSICVELYFSDETFCIVKIKFAIDPRVITKVANRLIAITISGIHYLNNSCELNAHFCRITISVSVMEKHCLQ